MLTPYQYVDLWKNNLKQYFSLLIMNSYLLPSLQQNVLEMYNLQSFLVIVRATLTLWTIQRTWSTWFFRIKQKKRDYLTCVHHELNDWRNYTSLYKGNGHTSHHYHHLSIIPVEGLLLTRVLGLIRSLSFIQSSHLLQIWYNLIFNSTTPLITL